MADPHPPEQTGIWGLATTPLTAKSHPIAIPPPAAQQAALYLGHIYPIAAVAYAGAGVAHNVTAMDTPVRMALCPSAPPPPRIPDPSMPPPQMPPQPFTGMGPVAAWS